MRTIIFYLFFSLCMQVCFAQSSEIDIVLQKTDGEKDHNKRIDILYEYFGRISESDPLLTLKDSQALLFHSQEKEDIIGEVLAYCMMGYIYRGLGNTVQSLSYNLRAVQMAHETGNEKLLAIAEDMTGTVYKDLADYTKALKMLHHAAGICERLNVYRVLESVYQNLSEVYIRLNNLDSALSYAQKDYELSMRHKYFAFFSYTLTNLGDIHARLGKNVLALTYYDMAIEEGFRINSSKMLNWAYTAKAQYFQEKNKEDSAVYYAKKAIASVENSAFTNYSVKPAKLLLDIYENKNSDSAVKYFKIYETISDSVYSTKIIQQTGLLTFENEVHQQELTAEKMKLNAERKQNIQYALLAISIITFVVIAMLLSRRIITNTKLIRFLGVLALLIVFEFLNLVLHPFLERITHHRPVLMLLGLVSIAALLVPLHHRLEKWAIERLVEKNKQSRLAAAKKTIEKLGDK